MPAGLGTALKPAVEPIVLARKPLAEGTVAANVLAHGTGALHIDAARVATGSGSGSGEDTGRLASGAKGNGQVYGSSATYDSVGHAAGRWPPNALFSHVGGPDGCQRAGVRRVRVAYSQPMERTTSPSNGVCYGPAAKEDKPVGYADADGYESVDAWTCVDGCPVAELDRQAGYSSERPRTLQRNGVRKMNGWGLDAPSVGTVHGDAGGKSRFFPTFGPDPQDAVPFRYQPKASRAERSAGLEDIAPTRSDYRPNDPDENSIRTRLHGSRAARNPHPCVKPLGLMSWLVRLIAGPGAVVLDPFCGSGSTLVACVREGFGFIGIEMSEEYAAIARARVAYEQEQRLGPLFAPASGAGAVAR